MRALALVGWSVGLCGLFAACNASGALDLTLSLPTDPALRPLEPTTVTVTATLPGETPVSNTAALAGGKVGAGELPIGTDIQVGVVLRDVSNRIVGVGEAGELVDVAADKATKVEIPVRRPFVFAAAPDGLHSFDPTLDPRVPEFQGRIMSVGAPLFAISVGGDRLAVVAGSSVFVVRTKDNMPAGNITIPMGARDASAVPGTHKIVVAHTMGISIVDLDTMNVATASVGQVDRVTAGPADNGTLYAYGLVGRVQPPELPPPFGACTGTSSIVVVNLDDPAVIAPKSLNAAVSDLAAAPDVAGVFATMPCTGQVARLVGDPTLEIAQLSLEKVSTLERAAVLTVAGSRVWAAGTATSKPACEMPTCGASSTVSCTANGSNDVLYVTEGASLIVQSIPFDGGAPIEFRPPGRRETMIDLDDDARQHAQVLKAVGVVPLDLVTLPGGQYVSLVTHSRYFISSLTGPFGVILPCLDAATNDWLLFDLASSSVAQRVRTFCSVQVVPATGADFPRWECEAPPPAEAATSSYQPTSVGALFGAR